MAGRLCRGHATRLRCGCGSGAARGERGQVRVCSCNARGGGARSTQRRKVPRAHNAGGLSVASTPRVGLPLSSPRR
eukprot:scaffold35626_cov124-Isochrysis_galbana.AAC.3